MLYWACWFWSTNLTARVTLDLLELESHAAIIKDDNRQFPIASKFQNGQIPIIGILEDPSIIFGVIDHDRCNKHPNCEKSLVEILQK